ncbi:repressible alkaline phosphatase [Emericellopsis atlantica]|uniref:Alkaline phosphatase n=1 Tax=Emericellopsis atlantica TaxID=2614577 RepID=A0A9P8CQT4_9HYPO|nr:repressible alkaline phosphatase [Emericellopsis atlantica]KAG9255988.1 repressible alkaline phosphatase [Emericellopsis atlantica]
MKTSAVLAGTMAGAAMGAIAPKNVIFVVPDGLAPASSTIARTYLAMAEGDATPSNPGAMPMLPVDALAIGNTFTHSANNLVTDSAAAGTALATGHKTGNGILGLLLDGKPVGSILESAKLHGWKTGLVVTSSISHATPAAFSSHVQDRNNFNSIAEQQIGFSHPLNQSVDIMFGGVAQNRSQFDDIELGKGEIRLPILGLFNDADLHYEADRKEQDEDVREPSLSEMTGTALNALHRATHCKDKGYFMMIEASRIDHASHAHDANAHLWDVLEYNKVIETVTHWIDEHPDTAMVSVADHETGGITLPGGWDPRELIGSRHSAEFLAEQYAVYGGDDKHAFLRDEILASYGLGDISDSDLTKLKSGDVGANLAEFLSARAGIKWSTGGHTGVDTTLYAYAAGEMGEQLKIDLAGAHDNTDIPKYLEEAMGLDLDEVTELLRENW